MEIKDGTWHCVTAISGCLCKYYVYTKHNVILIFAYLQYIFCNPHWNIEVLPFIIDVKLASTNLYFTGKCNSLQTVIMVTFKVKQATYNQMINKLDTWKQITVTKREILKSSITSFYIFLSTFIQLFWELIQIGVNSLLLNLIVTLSVSTK